jgi:hypothetical protein
LVVDKVDEIDESFNKERVRRSMMRHGQRKAAKAAASTQQQRSTTAKRTARSNRTNRNDGDRLPRNIAHVSALPCAGQQ